MDLDYLKCYLFSVFIFVRRIFTNVYLSLSVFHANDIYLFIRVSFVWRNCVIINVPRHDKSNKVTVRPAKTQISLGIRPVWSESWLSAWRKPGSLATHWAHSEDSDQTGRMPRLIWVFAGRTVTLLVLSGRGSNGNNTYYVPITLKAWYNVYDSMLLLNKTHTNQTMSFRTFVSS